MPLTLALRGSLPLSACRALLNLVREATEEVGITPTAFSFIGVIVDPDASKTDSATYHLYVVTAWDGGEPALVCDEHIELRWFTPDAALGLGDLALDEYRDVFRDIIRTQAGVSSSD